MVHVFILLALSAPLPGLQPESKAGARRARAHSPRPSAEKAGNRLGPARRRCASPLRALQCGVPVAGDVTDVLGAFFELNATGVGPGERLQVDTCQSWGLDTVLELYADCPLAEDTAGVSGSLGFSLGGPPLMANNDGCPPGSWSTASTIAGIPGGEVYFVRVRGFSGQTGQFTLVLNGCGQAAQAGAAAGQSAPAALSPSPLPGHPLRHRSPPDSDSGSGAGSGSEEDMHLKGSLRHFFNGMSAAAGALLTLGVVGSAMLT